MISILGAYILSARPELYVLAIGNGRYETNRAKFTDKTFVPFEQIPQAEDSAKLVAESMKRLGAKASVVLASKGGALPLSKKVIEDAIVKMRKTVEHAPKGSVFFIYYAGHGTSEGALYNQYWWPGNVTVSASGNRFSWVGERLTSLSDVAALSELKERPTIIISDACKPFDRTAVNDLRDQRLRNVLNDNVAENLGNIQDVLRALAEFKCTNPAVVFAAKPGFTARTAENPLEPAEQIGPIARRLLILEPKFRTWATVTIDQFIAELTTVDVDPQTASTTTNFVGYKSEKAASPILFALEGKKGS